MEPTSRGKRRKALREVTMRPLTEEETKDVLSKLMKYVGDNVEVLFNRTDATYRLRLHRDRVFYCRQDLLGKAQHFKRKNLLMFGTCLGRFSQSKKFRLHITALDILARYAKHKIWVKPSAEQQYLYGHHVKKAGLARISDDAPQYTGVVVYSMSDVPLGFGVTAKSTAQCRNCDPVTIVCFHQADVGEYIRSESSLI